MSQDLTGRTLMTLMEAGLARRIQGTENRVFGVACMAMGRRIVQVGPGLLRIEQRLGIPGVEIGDRCRRARLSLRGRSGEAWFGCLPAR